MNYCELSDDALVLMAKAGDELAYEEICSRYKNLVKIKARPYFILGADRDDIVQEGMIGLFKAIRDYDEGKQANFRTFSDMCITRQIITAIQHATRNKHIPLNSYISLSRPIDGDTPDRTLLDITPSGLIDNPEDSVIGRENFEIMLKQMEESLTDFEMQTLLLFIDGKSYEEIAKEIGRSRKSVDNALQRIKRKMQKTVPKDEY